MQCIPKERQLEHAICAQNTSQMRAVGNVVSAVWITGRTISLRGRSRAAAEVLLTFDFALFLRASIALPR